MPMSFPDMRSLELAAKTHNFRPPNEGESEGDFRTALADHVKPIDRVESFEIRTGKGWNQWSEYEKLKFLTT